MTWTELTKKLSWAHLQEPDEFVAKHNAGRVDDRKGLSENHWETLHFHRIWVENSLTIP